VKPEFAFKSTDLARRLFRFELNLIFFNSGSHSSIFQDENISTSTEKPFTASKITRRRQAIKLAESTVQSADDTSSIAGEFSFYLNFQISECQCQISEIIIVENIVIHGNFCQKFSSKQMLKNVK
jgi:hypothetical protein